MSLTVFHSPPIACSASPVFSNYPEDRATHIVKHLQSVNDGKIRFEVSELDEIMLENLRQNLIALHITTPDYLKFLASAYKSASISNDPDWFKDGRLIPAYFTRRKPLEAVPTYKRSGYYCLDNMTPIFSHTEGSVLTSALVTEMATRELCKDNAIVYVANCSPGHHAAFDLYAGYCFLNNAVFAARNLLEKIPDSKVVILDLDYHCGDGTAAMCEDDQNIMTISIHANPVGDYPSFTGFEEESTDRKINICPPNKATWKEYEPCLRKALDLIRGFNTSHLIIAFGADTWKKDPDPRPECRFALELEDYSKMGCMIKSLNLPVLITQEGGYDLEVVPKIVENFLFSMI